MKALVTGAAGFIGSHLVDALLAAGWEVIGLDNLSAGKIVNLYPALKSPRFTPFIDDICNVTPKLFEGVDVVFHQAASKKAIGESNPQRNLAVNVFGTFNVLRCATEVGVPRVVYASSGSVYGEGRQREDYPLRPASLYGVGKLAAEQVVSFFCRAGLDVVTLRYFHVYGPRQHDGPGGGVVAIFISRLIDGRSPAIYGSDEQVRSFTYVQDAVRANLLALNARPGSCYNVASSLRISVNELARILMRMTGQEHLELVHGAPLPGDVMEFDVDNSLIGQELGLVDWTPLEDGLRSTLEWFRAERRKKGGD